MLTQVPPANSPSLPLGDRIVSSPIGFSAGEGSRSRSVDIEDVANKDMDAPASANVTVLPPVTNNMPDLLNESEKVANVEVASMKCW